ncbi:hypothetical protein BVY02_00790 [bacterium J17]|nr:hypothetical protein BVY02_00790 [bacterium J17]
MSSDCPVVLFVDDDKPSVDGLTRGVQRRAESFDCRAAYSAEEALHLAKTHLPHVAVVDLSLNPEMGPESGLRLVSDLLCVDNGIRILILTGHKAERYGIQAIHVGASSFISKPASLDHLYALICDGVEHCELRREYLSLKSQAKQNARSTGLFSHSSAMKEVLDTVSYAASNKQAVLITGETGTGKGLVAHAIHRASDQKNAGFIRFQPSYGGHDLISSELFGHKRGTFTGALTDRKGLIEEAHRGTLFIDEVAELSRETQIALLEVLQEKSFRQLGSNQLKHSDFRLISATNKNIDQALSKDELREDFFHRIGHIRIHLPPLRERKEDIPALVDGFIESISSQDNLPIQGISSAARSRLLSFDWPGNIRQLQAVVEGGVYRAHYESRRFVEVEDLDIPANKENVYSNGASLREQVKMFENRLVKEALEKHNSNQTQAAKSLNLDRTSFRRIMERIR